jgi:hypothetical protein
MAFSDDLAHDPKSEKEFWRIIKETFVQVKGVLPAYRVEVREEALAGTLRLEGVALLETRQLTSFAIVE